MFKTKTKPTLIGFYYFPIYHLNIITIPDSA